ncbi:hypothetical protein SAMN05216203_2725 [Marinobacter daqiaonensis]|uniref:1-acyl-sn-glycerol-3-phosphate acyltransferase n=1 Tax=Marinobacter daqiaonensis TaxID=650891 RepID=A0A1I6J719_9GAMM|nr:hypothetical protein [Marinobacter daqiaonensis]SFR74737.1 hypothetical protein SAMN05216203_2725 [Marinobacter daqiaonensis]
MEVSPQRLVSRLVNSRIPCLALATWPTEYRIDRVIGCASIGMSDGGLRAWRIAHHLQDRYLCADSDRVWPRRSLPHLTQPVPDRPVEIPALIRAYMRLGARVCGEPCWDPECRCAELLVQLEGTTSAGLTVLPFFPRLIGAAGSAGVPIVPVSLAYLRGSDPCHISPFIGDDEFHHHLFRLLAAPAPEVRVTWHEAVTPGPGESARELSNRVRDVIVEGLRRSHQSAGVSGCPAATSSSVASRASMISRSK